MVSAKNMAINSGLMTIPPLKLKPFKAGYSKERGEPIIKNNNKGIKTIIPKAEVRTGNCLPVVSCLFLAHFLKIKLEIKAKTKAINTYENPFSNIGLGE